MENCELVWDGSENRIRESKQFDNNSASSQAEKLFDVVQGSCHCEKVTFSVKIVSQPISVLDCNCSICAKKGYLHLTVPKDRVSISAAALEAMTTYRFGTGVAQHTFCATCGVEALYVPRSNPDCYSVNARCLELDGKEIRIEPLDGKTFTGTLNVE